MQCVVFLATGACTARSCCRRCRRCRTLPPAPQHKLASLPASLPARVSPRQPLCLHLFNDHPPFKMPSDPVCQRGTLHSCSPATLADVTHTQVFISLLFTARHRSAHSPVCVRVCEENVCQPPTSFLHMPKQHFIVQSQKLKK